jgi:NAD(P)H-nitrite reductase large subunit
MNENNANQNDQVICSCTGTTKAKIIELINKGAKDLDKIASATGASTGCGSCDVEVVDILEEYGF